MSHSERFVTESNEKADELAKEGALLDEGFVRNKTESCAAKKRGGARSHAVCSQLPLLGGTTEEL